MRPFVFINLVLLGALLAMSAWLWPSLPEAIPLHFGLDGTPDRWGSRLGWWGLPGLAGALTLGMAGLGRWMMARPDLVNLPGKAKLLALPPARRRPVLLRVTDLFWATNALTLVLFGLVQWGIYRTAMGTPGRGLTIAVVVLAVAMGPLVLLGLPYVDAELKRQTKAHEAASATASRTSAPASSR